MNNFEFIDDIIAIKNTWEKTGLLSDLRYPDQLYLSQLLEKGSKFLIKLGNGIYDEVEEFHKFKSNEDFAGLFLSAISIKYRNDLKPFDLEDLILLLNKNAKLYYELQEKATPLINGEKKYLFDYESEFLTLILTNEMIIE